jgi:hypothetical protein
VIFGYVFLVVRIIVSGSETIFGKEKADSGGQRREAAGLNGQQILYSR